MLWNQFIDSSVDGRVAATSQLKGQNWRGENVGGDISTGRVGRTLRKCLSWRRNFTGSVVLNATCGSEDLQWRITDQVRGFQPGRMFLQANSLSKFLTNNFENKTNKTVLFCMSCFSLGSKTILISLVFKVPKNIIQKLFCLKQTFYYPVKGADITELD